MELELSSRDRAMLAGDLGPASRLAMRILVRMAAIWRAASLLDITGAHIDSALYVGDATLEYAEHLAELGARVAVPTTLNVSGVDTAAWQEWAVPPDWAAKAHRQMVAYEAMGCRSTWTCAPYQSEPRPAFGDQIAWGESSAIVFANSVLGARTERYPDLLDICAAITGRVPAVGLHLTEHRAGTVLIRLAELSERIQQDDAFFPVLGHLVGSAVQGGVPVLAGLATHPTEDQLKALGAAMASSGAVALFHVVGVTPEATTQAAAFHGMAPPREITVSLADLRDARRDLDTAHGAKLDMVVLGSPHFSFTEFQRLAELVAGTTRHPAVRVLITTGRGVKLMAERAGLLEPLERFGAELAVDTCILTSPMLPDHVRVLMTNSAKYAYYTPSLLGRQMSFGGLRDCVRSAVAGRVEHDEESWRE